jgi:hypothetical protein
LILGLSGGDAGLTGWSSHAGRRFYPTNISINLHRRYNLKKQGKKSWINIINPFRGLLVIEISSGKSWL